MELENYKTLFVKQVFEQWELMGYETRNKYEIVDEANEKIGYAAEQQKGVISFFARQLFGHWRSFDIIFFNKDRTISMIAHHPFRFFFQRLEIVDIEDNVIGYLQRRFSFYQRKFDVLNHREKLLFELESPFWKIWTFPFYKRDREIACINKKWSGGLTEVFTDRDNFQVTYKRSSLDHKERQLILAAAVLIDLQYFEKKASRNRFG